MTVTTDELTAYQLYTLYEASRFEHNEGWMSVDSYTSEVGIGRHPGNALTEKGLMEAHPSGFMYRLTDTGKQFVHDHVDVIRKEMSPPPKKLAFGEGGYLPYDDVEEILWRSVP